LSRFSATRARLAAEAADKAILSGHAIGPLHGIPIALKDLIEIDGRVYDGRLDGVGATGGRRVTCDPGAASESPPG